MKTVYALSLLFFLGVVFYNSSVSSRSQTREAQEHSTPPPQICEQAQALKREIKLLEIEIRTINQ